MSNALTIYEKMPDPLAAITTLGRAIAGSKMFGVENEFQGQVFALECLSRGIPPLMLAEEYDVIYGKLSRKAAASLGNFLKSGGKSRILCRTPEKVEVELEKPGVDKQVFTLTWENAQMEAFPYEGKEKDIVKALAAWDGGNGRGKQPELKPKYATPHSRMQMLWSRLVKDAVKAMTGEGVDTMGDPELDEDETPVAAGTSSTATASHGEVVDAEYEVKSNTAADGGHSISDGQGGASGPTNDPGQVQPSAAASNPDEPGSCTELQRVEIEGLFNRLGLTGDQRNAALAKRHAQVTRNLSFTAAAELAATLKAKWEAIRDASLKAANAGGSSQGAVKDAESVPSDGPCSETQQSRVKQLLGEIEQVKPGFTNEFKKRFFATGREKIAELTHGECSAMIEALGMKNMNAFFAESLKPKVKEPTGEPVTPASVLPTAAEQAEAAGAPSGK